MGFPSCASFFVDWAKSAAGVRGVLLVGSWARGAARADSDIDFVILADDPASFRDESWLTELGVEVLGFRDQDYGALWSRHLRVLGCPEIEASFAALSWAKTDPIDPGTRDVVQDGCEIVYDADGLLVTLLKPLHFGG